MKIYRMPKDLSHKFVKGIGYEIELTPQEILMAYEAQKTQYYAQDIAEAISNRILDNGQGSHYPVNWPMKIAKSLVEDYEQVIEGYNPILETEWELRDVFISNHLEEYGVDPETMERL